MPRIARSALSIALSGVIAAAFAGAADATGDDAATAKVLPKRWAKRHHVRRATGDPDHDGLSNWGELRSQTRPRRADTDGDGIADAREDREGDGVDNGSEEDAGTDPARSGCDGTDLAVGDASDGDHTGPDEDDEPIASLAEQGDEDDPHDEEWDDTACAT